MQRLSLTQRLYILEALHACFILTLLCTGAVGLVLFTAIISQPIRNCPVLHAIYTVFWISLSLSILQIILAIIFFVWFTLTFLCPPKSVGSVENSSRPAVPVGQPVYASNNPFDSCTTAVGVPCGQVYGPFYFSRSHCASDDTLDTYSSTCDCCHFRVGWFYFGSIFLGILSVGLILSLILVGNFLSEMDTLFNSEMASTFVEARVSFTSSKSSNNALKCWNIIQKTFQCCGQVNYSDWSSYEQRDVQSKVENSLPISCYFTNNVSANRNIYTSGCLNLIIKSLNLQLTASRIYLIVTFILLVITFLVDFCYTLYIAYTTLAENPVMECDNGNIVWQHTPEGITTRKISSSATISGNNHDELLSISSNNSSPIIIQNSVYSSSHRNS
ncbi:unnamed protein product [Schistosoma turkestanicum]|nr:unnamed protein product [Schistosoma turkestanicum]